MKNEHKLAHEVHTQMRRLTGRLADEYPQLRSKQGAVLLAAIVCANSRLVAHTSGIPPQEYVAIEHLGAEFFSAWLQPHGSAVASWDYAKHRVAVYREKLLTSHKE